jgi:hypothetical protein
MTGYKHAIVNSYGQDQTYVLFCFGLIAKVTKDRGYK